MKPCGCAGPCSQRCRNDRAAIRRVAQLRHAGRSAALVTVNAAQAVKLKPSAMKILRRLRRGRASNREILRIGGFRYGCRVWELRKAGHVIRCETGGPTPGVRWYTLETP
jgi:hypothetical protein